MTHFSALILSLIIFAASGEHASWLDSGSDIHRLQRGLLQEVSDDLEPTEGVQEEPEVTEEPIVYKGLAEKGVNEVGPRLFYDGSDFLMRLSAPIKVTVFPGGTSGEDPEKKLEVVHLNEQAVSVMGSMIGDDDFKVNLDWKSRSFGSDFKISNIQIHMFFNKSNSEYAMYKLEAKSLTINGKQIIRSDLEVKTKYGYKVLAPLGSSFCCYNPGMFEPKLGGGNEVNAFRVGITFPGLQLQVFGLKDALRVKFGPEWDCDSFMTIGVWVGLLVTLLFASVCVWGFTMLANIQTMDRFDDPRGKTIHVPQTD